MRFDDYVNVPLCIDLFGCTLTLLGFPGGKWDLVVKSESFSSDEGFMPWACGFSPVGSCSHAAMYTMGEVCSIAGESRGRAVRSSLPWLTIIIDAMTNITGVRLVKRPDMAVLYWSAQIEKAQMHYCSSHPIGIFIC